MKSKRKMRERKKKCIAFHKNNFRPLSHDVHFTKQYKKNIKWNTKEDVTPQSVIFHTLWL